MFGKSPINKGKPMSEEQKEKIRAHAKILSGTDNFMYGKTNYEVWMNKYGKEEADKKEKHRRKKMSVAATGEKNSMYGKPSPKGSGNGWSGWYKGWFFRSLHELSYMINVIERFNLPWETGEQKQYSIPYINWDGGKRNYFCDFIVGKKYCVECKPKKLHKSTSVLAKKNGADKFCRINGLKYKLVSPKKLADEKISELHKNGKIKFTERYERKFRQYTNSAK
jgi:hypothetical protein